MKAEPIIDNGTQHGMAQKAVKNTKLLIWRYTAQKRGNCSNDAVARTGKEEYSKWAGEPPKQIGFIFGGTPSSKYKS